MTPIYTLTDVEVDEIVCFPSVSVFDNTLVVSTVGFLSDLDDEWAIAPLSVRWNGPVVLGPSNPYIGLRYIAAQLYLGSDVCKLLVLMRLRGRTHRVLYGRLFITMQSTELRKAQ